MHIISKHREIFLTILLAFSFSYTAGIIGYINSSALAQFVPQNLISFIYIISALASICALSQFPNILERIGNKKLILLSTILYCAGLIGMATITQPIIFVIAFLVTVTSTVTMPFSFDIFLEEKSERNNTGTFRSWFLTAINLAWVLSPASSAFFIEKGNGGYGLVYLIAACICIFTLIFALLRSRRFIDPIYEKISLLSGIKKVWNDSGMKSIFLINLSLQIFYGFMVIYTPIYLHTVMGFSWINIGTIFTIMLLPFILFQIPSGIIADKYLGEKEMLTGGLLLMIFSTAMLPLLHNSLALWSVFLFLTRTGASLVEVMSETYFFKHADAKDAEIIGLFRVFAPFGTLLVSVIAFFAIQVFSLPSVFFITAFILCLVGLVNAFRLHDTK